MPQWRPIEDLPDDWTQLAIPGLRNLATIWDEQAHRLANANVLREFHVRLCRQWAIETGIIENIYSIDRGTTQILIEKGLHENLIAHGTTNRPAKEIIAILTDHMQVIDGLFDFVGQTRELSTSYIKQLHQAFTQHQFTTIAVNGTGREVNVDLLRGTWKQWPNNPSRSDGTVHEYAPPEQVASEMDRLIDWHQAHLAKGVSPEVEAAWLHHRFTQIHPFQDGNGRVARALGSLVLLRGRWFPLSVDRDQRSEYIECLERADAGDLKPLIHFFGELQRERFIQALGIADGILREQRSMHQLVQAIGDRIEEPETADAAVLHSVTQIAHEIETSASETFSAAESELNEMFEAKRPTFSAAVDRNSDANVHWFRRQIFQIAHEFKIFVNPSYRGWVRLRISKQNGMRTNFVLAVHAVGTRFVGVCAATAFIEFRDPAAEKENTVDVGSAIPLCREPFSFTYNDSAADAVQRFTPWMNDVLIAGLERFRREVS